MIPVAEILRRAVQGDAPARHETAALLRGVAAGEVPAEALASFLTALAIHGETAEALLGLVDVARESLVPVPCRPGAIDVCGTGGDGQHTVNVSTAAAFVAAAAGARVAKHGNHGISSRCGSADVMAALGCAVRLAPADVAEAIDTLHLGFIYAPAHHPLFAQLAPLRRALGFRTAFNLLGPLCNPAGVRRQLLGASSPAAQRRLAEVLAALGTERALVVHTPGPHDEVTLTAPAAALLVEGGTIAALELAPADFGCAPVDPACLAGGDAAFNAARIVAVLDGGGGGLGDVVCANAACALFVAGLAPDVGSGFAQARAAVAAGAARGVLARLRAFTAARAAEAGRGGAAGQEGRRDAVAG